MQVSIRHSVALAFSMVAVALAQPSLADNADATSEAARLLGAWDCSASRPGSTSEQVYRRVNDTTLALAFVVHTAAGVTGSVNETLTYDRANGVWSLDAGKNRFFDAEHLAAPAWGARDWIFSGTESAHGTSRSVRIVYSYFPPDSFVREHQVRSGDRWNADGAFVCLRAPLEAGYDVGVPPHADVADRATGPATVQSTLPSPVGTDKPKARKPTPKAAEARKAAVATSRASPAPLPRHSIAAASAATPTRKTPRAAATPSPSRVALAMTPPPLKTRAGGIDRAYDLTHGVWECKTFGGADATHTYTREADGTIMLHNVLSIAKHDYAIDELYRFDRAKKSWTTITSGGAYAGVAGRWLTDKWVFVGDMLIGDHRVPAEMIYSRLGDRAFRRDFIRLQNGARATFAAETCQLR